MPTETNSKLPIGYWLKQADRVLTEQIDLAQAVNGITRTEWQILNLLQENGRATKDAIFQTMQTFIDAAECQKIFNDLVACGWLSEEAVGTALQLTEMGQHQHEHIFTTQKAVRQRAMQGISPDEYTTTIRVLQQIVENLDQSEKSALF